MNMVLHRYEEGAQGIFGKLYGVDAEFDTLEHSFAGRALIPPGNYRCVRGPHRLHGMTKDFETFEVLGIPGHSGLLFHWGNYNRDSQGCILVGASRQGDMICGSRAAFATFMALQKGEDSFLLVVAPCP